MIEPSQEIPAISRTSRLERRLRRDSPVRSWLASRKADTEAGSAAALMGALTSPRTSDWADRAVACHALGTIALSASERAQANHILVHAIEAPSARHTRANRIGTAVFRAGVLNGLSVAVTFGVACIQYIVFQQDLPETSGWRAFVYLTLRFPGNMLLTACLLFAGLTWLSHKRNITIQKAAAIALASMGDPTGIVALHNQVRDRTAIWEEALLALRAIVPRVTADWYGHMPPDTTDVLVTLACGTDETLAMEALVALERAGSGSAVTVITRLAREGKTERVRAQAGVVLPILIARQRRETSAGYLLRPSEAITSEHLVRPVYGTDPDTTNLLQASDRLSDDPSR